MMKGVTIKLLTVVTILLASANSAIATVDKNEIPTNDAKSLQEVAMFLQSEGA